MSSINKATRNQKSFIVEELHQYDILLDKREIFLHGYIDNTEEDPGVEYRSANKFLKNLRLLESIDSKPITIHQHSVGGGWCEGMMMYDVIKNSQCRIMIVNHGEASSIGAVITQAADLRIMMPNSWMMIHDGYISMNGHTYKQAMSWGEWNKKTKKIADKILLESCKNGLAFKNQKDAQIAQFLKARLDQKEDWLLDASESVLYGLADGVLGQQDYENIEQCIEKLQS